MENTAISRERWVEIHKERKTRLLELLKETCFLPEIKEMVELKSIDEYIETDHYEINEWVACKVVGLNADGEEVVLAGHSLTDLLLV